jgi:hypothetical protein
MKRLLRELGAVLFAAVATVNWTAVDAQTRNDATSTIRVHTSLVLVDVIAENTKTACAPANC